MLLNACPRGSLTETGHRQSSDCHKAKADSGFSAQSFSKYKIGKGKCEKNAHFINRNNDAYHSVLNGVVIAQPRSTCCNTGKEQKNQFPLIQMPEL